jgi:hypothetical protein
VKSPDQIARELARELIDAAQESADEGRGFSVPVAVLRALRIVPAAVSSYTLDEAARWLDIPQRILDAEVQHHLVVRDIVHGRTGAPQRGR